MLLLNTLARGEEEEKRIREERNKVMVGFLFIVWFIPFKSQ